jgi:uncharacterized protein (TIGR01777 family)
LCEESTPISPGNDFSTEVGHAWEAAFNEALVPQTRKVLFRIGFVLGRTGGALKTLVKLTKSYLGGAAGSGEQYISWIHIEDLNRMIQCAIEDPLEGAFHVTGPSPVTNKKFMAELRKVLHRPWSPPVPEWMIKIGCFFMRTEPELILKSRRCVPQRFLKHEFSFKFPELEGALSDLLENSKFESKNAK